MDVTATMTFVRPEDVADYVYLYVLVSIHVIGIFSIGLDKNIIACSEQPETNILVDCYAAAMQ